MSDITELERRLTSALDRISKNASALAVATPAVDEGQVAELTSANADLSERVAGLEAQTARQTDQIENAATENARLNAVIDALRAHTDALSDANVSGTSAGDEINGAMASELTDMRAARKADIRQLDEILAELAPAVKEA